MKLFENIQRVVEVGKLTKVVVPASFSLVLDNKTDVPVIIYDSQSSKIGFPILAGESMEIENIPEDSEFWIKMRETEIKENQGFFTISRPFIEATEENNTVIINQ